MVAHEVPRVQTPLWPVEMARALRDGHLIVFGVAPTDARLACAWAHCAIEHKQGHEIYCNSLGHIASTPSWDGPYYAEGFVPERIRRNPDVWKRIPMRFRAYDSPARGAADYWRQMSGKFADALALFDQGLAHAAAFKLSELVWYTAPVVPYAATMTRLEAQARATVLLALAETLAGLDGETAGRLSDLSSASMLGGGLPAAEDGP